MSLFKDKIRESAAKNDAEAAKKDTMPKWAKTSSQATHAFDAINKLKNEKLAYIAKHSKKTAFIPKKTYEIKLADVGRFVTGDTKYVFYRASYSSDLREYLVATNKALVTRKEERLSGLNKPVRDENKAVVYDNYQFQKKRADELDEKLKLASIETMLNLMPLKTKIKLGLV
jgi:hypothetical protein